MKNILEKLIWYARRPRFYGDLMHRGIQKISRTRMRRNDSADEAAAWCASRAVDTRTGLTRLTGATLARPAVDQLYPEQLQAATDRADDCPVQMGGPGDLDLLYWSAEHLQASRIIETGVAYGWSSLALLLSLKNRPDARLISTDMPYPCRNNEPYVGCIVPGELKDPWQVIADPDRRALPEALAEAGELDMCHYDSDKSYDGRTWAYSLLWRAIKPGGFFISDDIGDNTAFRDFSRSIERPPVVIRHRDKYIGVLVKPA
jgi:predicted O-methyltransferase YrrM